MTTARRCAGLGRLLVLAALLAAPACGRESAGWTPVLEQGTTTPLRTETARALAEVRAGLAALPPQADASAEALRRAERTLSHLDGWYLPLLEARERSHEAYRRFLAGDADASSRELQQIRELLEGVARGGSERVAREVHGPLETLDSLEAALGHGDRRAAAPLFDALATHLNDLFLKGALVLRDEGDGGSG